ncbi:Exon junction complexPym [Penicillium sp. IBT 31633x]|nr:Exon junction complexPym [Penicillium sp. IBT 31633x]
MPSNVSPSGIVTNPETGERLVPSSSRPDGTIRKQLRVKPGYKPKEDIQRYKPPGARSIMQKSDNQGEPAPANESSSLSSKAEAEVANTGDKTFKELKAPLQTVETDKSEAPPESSKAGNEKSNFVMAHKAYLKQPDATRDPMEETKTGDESFTTINKNTKHQGIPLRPKKSTKRSATARSKNMDSNKWSVLASADEGFGTEVGFAAKKSAAQRAKKASKKKNAVEGKKEKSERDKDEKERDEKDKDEKYKDEKEKDEKDKDEKDKDEKDKDEKDKAEEDKDKTDMTEKYKGEEDEDEKDLAKEKEDSLTKESPEKEAILEQIPSLLEMREMLRTLPTMASLGFKLPKTHKSRKANTCHTSYYTKPRSAERNISWKVIPDPEEAEQWFDAETTLEHQV